MDMDMDRRSDRADKNWRDWLKLMAYFDHELTEGEITQDTYHVMTECLGTFKPWIEIFFEGDVEWPKDEDEDDWKARTQVVVAKKDLEHEGE